MRRLAGWTHTGGMGCRGRETPRMPDGSPEWSRPAHEPDNSLCAVAGRLLLVGTLYAGMAALFSAGFWVSRQPRFADASAWLILSMPGPGTYWQAGEALAAIAAAVVAGIAATRWVRSRPVRTAAGVRIEVLPSVPDPTIPAGQLVYRRFDSPALAQPPARPELRDAGSAEIDTLVFRLVPSFLLFVALVTACNGTERTRQVVWPLLAGALLLAWLGRHIRCTAGPQAAAVTAQAALDHLPDCESCGRAPGTVTVTFLDAATFHVCALCLTAGSHLALDPQSESAAAWRREVQP